MGYVNIFGDKVNGWTDVKVGIDVVEVGNQVRF
jgi:hypothetical protein